MFWFATLICSVPAYGAIIVQVQDASIAAGGTGFVDVLISSDGLTGPDDLYSAVYQFKIDGLAVDGDLTFQSTQSDSETTEPGASGYVFGNVPTGNFAAGSNTPFLLLDGSDFRGLLPPVTLTTTQQLLARLELQHTQLSPSAVGNTFTISLENNAFTDFQSDDGGTPATLDPISFSSFGTVTITSAAVPEPGTFVALTIAAASFCGHRLRRRKV